MNVRAFIVGFARIVSAFGVAALMAGPFRANGAQVDSFQIRRVVEKNESANAETLPFARAGGESSLRVLKKPVLDGSDIARAVAQKDPGTGSNGVLVTLTEKGKERFASVTEGSIGKRLAIVVDGKIVAAPVIRTKIPGGSLVVSGNFTEKEAADLAEKFNGESSGKK
jgi:preprotein translocase subunit SecD